MKKDKQNARTPKGLRMAFKAAGFTVDVTSSVVSSVFKVFGSLLLILLIAGLLFACIFAYYVKNFLTPNMDLSLEDYQLSESSTIWYQNSAGEWQQLKTLVGNYKRIWADIDEIPEYMQQALVAIEDKRFYEHKGVDWYRTSGAFVEMFARMETGSGGSTITQQLIKNLTGKDEITIQRKLTEIFGALELEKKYNKQEIMEWYLNAVYFGEGCYGVQAAAHTYFGKDVSELSLAEAAAIVGITNKPTYYDPFYNEENNKQRQEIILREMYEQGYIDYQTWQDAVAEELVFTYTPGSQNSNQVYSYYEEVVIYDVMRDLMEAKGISQKAARTLLFNAGYQIYCCQDANIQSIADSIYQDTSNLPRTGSAQQLQSAIVIMDPNDGRILALEGGVGEKTRSFELNRAVPVSVDGFDYGGATRSPGSSIKPLASYAPAINEGLITPDTLVNDSPNIHLSGTDWYPHNDNYENYGTVTIYTALKWSLNTVAAQIIDKLTPQTAYNYLTERLGFTSLVPDDASYSPMALGQLTNGVSVREMAAAYCAFVHDGVFTESRTYTMVTDSKGNVVLNNEPKTINAFSPNTAYCMTWMMKKGVEEGTGQEARLYSMPVAGKTGTSGDYKDRWFAGCTPYYVAVVWTGFDTPERINLGGNPAAQLWRKVMAPVHEGLEWRDFTYPYLAPDTGIFNVNENEYYTDNSGGGTTVVIDDNGNSVTIDNGGNAGNGITINNAGGGDTGGATIDQGGGTTVTVPEPGGNDYGIGGDTGDGNAAIVFG